MIAPFDDAEESGRFAGTPAFIREYPWMPDVRVAISVAISVAVSSDTAICGPIVTNEVGSRNGWIVAVWVLRNLRSEPQPKLPR